MAGNRTYDECSICLSLPTDPHILPACKHYFCGACINNLRPIDDELRCPNCRAIFTQDEIHPYIPPEKNAKYCLDLECSPDSGCKKLHIDNFFTDQPATEYVPPPPPEEAPRPATPETWKPPPKAKYCFDVCCPGGLEATCGRKHESDFGLA
ncbi:unnamed protein product [Mesocestoides corti]|uniref:RING-type domain-containing protein n=1 Tax=Mesocestoides corti TaxID=53468 RepID=A0A0R3U4H2_MESCO|nr:unnamed protein product [Mesocestoides corti]